jgi:TrmH family RNA methyltransferase
MPGKNILRFIVSLRKKKERDEKELFVIEGDKLVREFLNSEQKIIILIAKPEFISGLSPDQAGEIEEIIPVSYDELRKASSLTTPHNAIAVIRKSRVDFRLDDLSGKLSLALDFIQDPGNLGTIIRAAAWFGIENIICSGDSVDVYNPKVIQASMGAILNVRVHYVDLTSVIKSASEKGIPVFGTMVDGESIYSVELDKRGIILLGNESKGISDELIPYITTLLSIPRFNEATYGIESLNVGMAASIVLSEFARQNRLQRLPD